MIYDMIWYDMIWYDTIWYGTFNRNWVDTRWQYYSTHLHTNSKQNNTINNLTGKSAGRALSLRVIPWHLPSTEEKGGKSTEKPQSVFAHSAASHCTHFDFQSCTHPPPPTPQFHMRICAGILSTSSAVFFREWRAILTSSSLGSHTFFLCMEYFRFLFFFSLQSKRLTLQFLEVFVPSIFNSFFYFQLSCLFLKRKLVHV